MQNRGVQRVPERIQRPSRPAHPIKGTILDPPEEIRPGGRVVAEIPLTQLLDDFVLLLQLVRQLAGLISQYPVPLSRILRHLLDALLDVPIPPLLGKEARHLRRRGEESRSPTLLDDAR